MANYIDKEIICEAYVHLDIDASLSQAEILKIKNHVKHYFDERVKFLLGDSVETTVESAEGSLKLTLTAYAGIAALVGIMGAADAVDFSDFALTIKATHEDSRMLAEATNLETIFATRTPSCDRLHAEARTGLVGKTAKLITALETLVGHAQNARAPSTKTEVLRIDQIGQSVIKLDNDARKILAKVRSDEDRYCLAAGLYAAFKQLPSVLPAERELFESADQRDALERIQQDQMAMAAIQRYKAAVKTAKAELKKIAEESQPKKA